MGSSKVVISKRAALARINRKLKKSGELLKACKRDSRGWTDLGDFYAVDMKRNAISRSKLKLGDIARKLNALAAWEIIED